MSAPATAQATYPEPECAHCQALLDGTGQCPACDRREVPLSPFLKAVLGLCRCRWCGAPAQDDGSHLCVCCAGRGL